MSIENIVKKLRESRILHEREDYSSKSRDELIQMAQDGDQLAVETLISTHQDFIKKMSSKYFLDSGDKDDVEQLATIAFWDAIRKWDFTGDFEAYAGMTIKRKMADALRRDDTEKTKINTKAVQLDAPMASDDEGGEVSLGSTLPSKNLSPEEEYLGVAGARELMKFMKDNLSETERNTIMMYIKGYKVSEIAEETGMKYKSVENSIMRVKNKLADFLRARESKKINENRIEFSDEEKQILMSVLNKISVRESIKESAASKQLSAKYEKYTEEQLDDELEDIEFELEDIISEIRYIDYSRRENSRFEKSLNELSTKLLAMEEYLTDEQFEKSEEISFKISRALDTEYIPDPDEPAKIVDPYAERGLKRSDFF